MLHAIVTTLNVEVTTLMQRYFQLVFIGIFLISRLICGSKIKPLTLAFLSRLLPPTRERASFEESRPQRQLNHKHIHAHTTHIHLHTSVLCNESNPVRFKPRARGYHLDYSQTEQNNIVRFSIHSLCVQLDSTARQSMRIESRMIARTIAGIHYRKRSVTLPLSISFRRYLRLQTAERV